MISRKRRARLDSYIINEVSFPVEIPRFSGGESSSRPVASEKTKNSYSTNNLTGRNDGEGITASSVLRGGEVAAATATSSLRG